MTYDDWIPIFGWVDPPPKVGHRIEFKELCFMGIRTHYRYIKLEGE